MKRTAIFLIFISFLAARMAAAQDWKNEKYLDAVVLGWKVKINTKLVSGDTSILERSLEIFNKELYDISNILPPKALVELKNVVFWFETETIDRGRAAEFLNSGSRLASHGLNPAKGGGIEIVPSRYIAAKVTLENWVVLHELAHAYHSMVLSYDNSEIIGAYKASQASGLYIRVRTAMNFHRRGYASTNYREYFAELSTMYFGHINYYPFDRADLLQYDKKGYDLVEKMWRVNEK